MRNEIVLFVEGEGDASALPFLVKRLITDYQAWDVVRLNSHAYRLGAVNRLIRNDFEMWRSKLQAALKRRQTAAVLLVLDGDVKVGGARLCAKVTAMELAGASRRIGGATILSVAVVFAVCEFESWLIAGAESLLGKALPDGRPGLKRNSQIPKEGIEQMRDAKGWLNRNMQCGYKPTLDQLLLTQLVDVNAIRKRGMRSFTRLESALHGLIDAIRAGSHVVTPQGPG